MCVGGGLVNYLTKLSFLQTFNFGLRSLPCPFRGGGRTVSLLSHMLGVWRRTVSLLSHMLGVVWREDCDSIVSYIWSSLEGGLWVYCLIH